MWFSEDAIDVDLNIHYGPTVTIAEMSITLLGIKWLFVGESKKHPNDEYNRQVGEAYAVARALENGAQIMTVVADSELEDETASDVY